MGIEIHWTRCLCDEWWCPEHGEHVSECACPPVEDLEHDPYELAGVRTDSAQQKET